MAQTKNKTKQYETIFYNKKPYKQQTSYGQYIYILLIIDIMLVNINSTSLNYFDTSIPLIKFYPNTLHYPVIWLNHISLSYRSISPHITTLHLTSLYFTSHHYTTPHITTLHLTSLHFTSHRYNSTHITTLHLTSLRFTSHHYTSPHFTSLHF